ncbi:hypothetical protein AB0D67_30680 [Streptosporangium sp. NPDC048047]|uniref:hypothetical protein n=1 Tax=Streptosporangium sp. NPDC048047 TaxID=3155748 RepID=UPI00341508AB
MICYISSDEARREFTIVLRARPVAGEPAPSDEPREVRWVPGDEIDSLTMGRSMRLRIRRYLAGTAEGLYIG